MGAVLTICRKTHTKYEVQKLMGACTHCPKLTGAAAPIPPTLTRTLRWRNGNVKDFLLGASCGTGATRGTVAIGTIASSGHFFFFFFTFFFLSSLFRCQESTHSCKISLDWLCATLVKNLRCCFGLACANLLIYGSITACQKGIILKRFYLFKRKICFLFFLFLVFTFSLIKVPWVFHWKYSSNFKNSFKQ